ncbi:MAG: DUF4442 domain-containing protein [Bacteroidota bacterium]|nr:DUF4442 domain-containing protein [Bacteroidota bacterium]
MKESKFQKLVNNRFLFRIYLLKSLPMAYIAGIRVSELTPEKAITTIKFSWLTQNPFRSMYFACQAMAAEMSTGLLVLNSVYGATPPISMLIIKNTAFFHKKAVGKITFSCMDGEKILQAISELKNQKEGIIMDVKSLGTDEQGDTVAEFIFTWSLKQKK